MELFISYSIVNKVVESNVLSVISFIKYIKKNIVKYDIYSFIIKLDG